MRLAALLLVASCGRIAFEPIGDAASASDAFDPLGPWPTLTGQWTWVGGNDIGRQPASYGVLGVAAASNKPGARDNCGSWHVGGSLWLHGGYGYATSSTANGRLNDLWRYELASGWWTWMRGAAGLNVAGTYGTLGQSGPTLTPGARNDCTSWSSADALWLLGGVGLDMVGTNGELGDLWRFDIALGEWAWVGGSNVVGAAPTYGMRGVPSPLNTPGARDSMFAWRAADGAWLFAGADQGQRREDLWHFDATTNEWTWVAGSQTQESAPVHGALGVPSATNTPGGRSAGCAWSAPDELWLFGGTSPAGRRNDLWRYTISTQQWTWIGGSSAAMQPGIYANRGNFDPTAQPGARVTIACWQDARGNLWLFGGSGIDSIGTAGPLNDLWVYSRGLGQWAWVTGADRASQLGVYGTRGVSDPSNIPGSRLVAGQWFGDDGSLWLFGGDNGYDSIGGNTILDDLWRYGP